MGFDRTTIDAVWKKGTIVSGVSPNEWRKDECGAWIAYNQYGDRSTEYGYGWEIDHITSQDHGGGDELSNLRPLQWKNNTSKGTGRLVCAVTAHGNQNGPA
jgi:hypothetical protein